MPIPMILPLLFWGGEEFSNHTLMHPNVRRLMAERTYDLVIVELFVTEAIIGLGQHFNAPVIAVSSFSSNKWVNDLVGTPAPMSYVPHAFSTFSDRMSLGQRLLNTLLTGYETAMINVMNYPFQRRVYARAFPQARLSYDEAMTNVSLVLLNTHFSVSSPRPYVPNMIEVGGMHVKRTTKPLPERLQQFLDTAPEGVIYFSLGSFVKSTFMSKHHRDTFVKVFATLPQRVIWKFEEDLPGRSDNVLIDNWLPQNDILAHPNVRLFITHGGLLSTTESVFHGVPVVGMPIFGDQMRNVHAAVQDGWGVQLSYTNVTEESLRWALQTALSDKRIAAQAQAVSRRYRDQPLTPLDTAVYWSEYVLRHHGAPHLRSASMDLIWVQYHNVDVLAILVVLSALAFVVFYKLMLWWIRRRRATKAADGGKPKRN